MGDARRRRLVREARRKEAESLERSRLAEAERQRAAMECNANMKTLFHATRTQSADAICSQQRFIPGRRGFLGPGIYFSSDPGNARRYSQCHGAEVVIQCDVNLGKMGTVDRGH